MSDSPPGRYQKTNSPDPLIFAQVPWSIDDHDTLRSFKEEQSFQPGTALIVSRINRPTTKGIQILF
jgi:hypothetical protein